MSYQAPLPNTGVLLPVPGSGQGWEVAVFNGNLSSIDSAIGADRGRLTAIEAKIGNNAVVPRGTSAARDGFYGVPGTAAARVALANSAPSWFNTDKGYLERYFAPTSDSGQAGYNTLYARGKGGWVPEGAGLIPINWPTPIITGNATGVVVNGNTLLIPASNTGVTKIAFDGLFTDDFTQYRLIANGYAQGSAQFWQAQFRIAGTDYANASGYAREVVTASGSSIVASNTPTDSKLFWVPTAQSGFAWIADIFSPTDAARPTQVISDAMRSDTWGKVATAVSAGAHDGLSLFGSAGAYFQGEFKLFGYAGGHI
jgi:hypothetical protein